MKKLILALTILATTFVNAGEIKPYTKTLFNELQSNGAPILIDVNAKWCGTCKKQGKVIKNYMESNPEIDLTVLKVDYDDQKTAVQYFKAPKQSTLVVFNNGEEIGRMIAETNKELLEELFNKAK